MSILKKIKYLLFHFDFSQYEHIVQVNKDLAWEERKRKEQNKRAEKAELFLKKELTKTYGDKI